MYDANHYVRMAGLKLLLLGACFAAVAAAIPVTNEASLAEANWGGMRLLHLILGTMGAGASLFFLPQLTGLVLGRTVSCGILCSVVGTPFMVAMYTRYIGQPVTGAENVMAVALGVGGVYIIPGAQALWDGFRSNPWGFIDRLRGRGGDPGAGGPGGQP